ncbi:MAG: intersectin-EH binding protein Ibp1 [Mycobacterium sp.]
MATMKFSARRMIIAGGFAVAVAAAPAIAFVAAPAPAATPLACAGGEENDLYTNACVPHLVPNAGEPYSVIGGNPDLAAVNLPGGGGSIPCTGHNSGQCIGLAEEQQVPLVSPESSVGSSPTVTGSTGSVG